MTTISKKKIAQWETSLNQIRITPQLMDNILERLKGKDLDEWEDAMMNDKEEDFFSSKFKKGYMEDLDLIKSICESNSEFKECKCVLTKNTPYNFGSKEEQNHRFRKGECYMNVSMLAMTSPNVKIIYGIVEDQAGLPIIHFWNKIDDIFIDISLELLGSLGKKYWIIAEFEPSMYYYKNSAHNKKRPKRKLNKFEAHQILIDKDDENVAKVLYTNLLEKLHANT